MTARLLFVLIATLFPVSSAYAASAADITDARALEAFVDGVVEPLMAEGHSPSGTFALMKDGSFVFSKGYGIQNTEENTPVDPNRTLFRPGSISKLFTWVAIMQLAERGEVDLDADINTYLTNFQIEDSWPGQPVTLRHCLTHTPGFEDGAFGYLIVEDPKRTMPLAEAMAYYQPERVNPPGKVGAYSNYCTALTGLVVQNVAGIDFNEYLEQRIFGPLRMLRSSFREPLPEGLDETMATAYKYEEGRYVARPYELVTSFSPAGAMATTGPDLLRFGQMLLNGGELNGQRILSEASVRELTRTQWTIDDRIKGMGLGFLHYDLGETDTFGHDGGTTAFVSHFGVTPKANLVVFWSFSGPGGGKVTTVLKRAFYERFFPLAEVDNTPPSDFNSRAGRYAGRYINWRRGFSNLEAMMGLMGQMKVAPNGKNELVIGDDRYVEVEKNLFRNVENSDLIAFEEGESGEITGMAMSGVPFMPFYKAPWYAVQEFNFGLLAIGYLVFLMVALRHFFQRREIQAMPDADRSASRAALWASLAHLVALAFGAYAMSVGLLELMKGIPTVITVWLWFPIIAALLGLYLLYKTVIVWKDGLLVSVFARARFTFVAICALGVTWVFWYWRLLGFNYFA